MASGISTQGAGNHLCVRFSREQCSGLCFQRRRIACPFAARSETIAAGYRVEAVKRDHRSEVGPQDQRDQVDQSDDKCLLVTVFDSERGQCRRVVISCRSKRLKPLHPLWMALEHARICVPISESRNNQMCFQNLPEILLLA